MFFKLLAYFIIPAYTLLFTRGYSWFTTNFSVIGNFFDKKLAFFIWGILVGIYFYLVHRKVKVLLQPGPVCSRLIPSALVLLFCAVTTPYLPEELPLKSFLHIVFALVSTLLLLLFLAVVVWSQYLLFPWIYRSFLAGLFFIVLGSAALLALAGIISTALELFITFTTVAMSDRLTDRIQEQASFVQKARQPWHG